MLVEKLNALRAENDSEAGFTLIELMIVVVIIGILAAVAIPVFLNQQKGAIAAGVKSDVKNTVTNIATALVKNPTTSDVSSVLSAGTGQGIVTSDAATTVKIGVGTPSGTNFTPGTATWQNWAVEGTNSGLAADSAYVYNSTTGKYVGEGDLA